MNRRKFIAAGCVSCMGGGMMVSLLEGCATASEILNASIAESDMVIPLASFEVARNNAKQFKRYLVVQNEILQYPICVYRFDENKYEALWMRCTHMGTELQVFGDRLQCPAHGSAFNNHGLVENGPANNPLRTFPVTIAGDHLKISLK